MQQTEDNSPDTSEEGIQATPDAVDCIQQTEDNSPDTSEEGIQATPDAVDCIQQTEEDSTISVETQTEMVWVSNLQVEQSNESTDLDLIPTEEPLNETSENVATQEYSEGTQVHQQETEISSELVKSSAYSEKIVQTDPVTIIIGDASFLVEKLRVYSEENQVEVTEETQTIEQPQNTSYTNSMNKNTSTYEDETIPEAKEEKPKSVPQLKQEVNNKIHSCETKLFSCPYCDHSASDAAALYTHLHNTHDCPRSTKNKGKLRSLNTIVIDSDGKRTTGAKLNEKIRRSVEAAKTEGSLNEWRKKLNHKKNGGNHSNKISTNSSSSGLDSDTGKRAFACQHCSKLFTKSSALYVHLQNGHRSLTHRQRYTKPAESVSRMTRRTDTQNKLKDPVYDEYQFSTELADNGVRNISKNITEQTVPVTTIPEQMIPQPVYVTVPAPVGSYDVSGLTNLQTSTNGVPTMATLTPVYSTPSGDIIQSADPSTGLVHLTNLSSVIPQNNIQLSTQQVDPAYSDNPTILQSLDPTQHIIDNTQVISHSQSNIPCVQTSVIGMNTLASHTTLEQNSVLPCVVQMQQPAVVLSQDHNIQQHQIQSVGQTLMDAATVQEHNQTALVQTTIETTANQDTAEELTQQETNIEQPVPEDLLSPLQTTIEHPTTESVSLPPQQHTTESVHPQQTTIKQHSPESAPSQETTLETLPAKPDATSNKTTIGRKIIQTTSLTAQNTELSTQGIEKKNIQNAVESNPITLPPTEELVNTVSTRSGMRKARTRGGANLTTNTRKRTRSSVAATNAKRSR